MSVIASAVALQLRLLRAPRLCDGANMSSLLLNAALPTPVCVAHLPHRWHRSGFCAV